MNGEIYTIAAQAVAAADRIGRKPAGPGHELGDFGSLRHASPEAVADTVCGPSVGDRAPEHLAKERFRWVRGLSQLDRASLGAACLDYMCTGLLRVVVVEGERHWQRQILKTNPRRDFNQPPQSVREEPVDPNADRTARRLRDADGLDQRIDARLRAHGLIR